MAGLLIFLGGLFFIPLFSVVALVRLGTASRLASPPYRQAKKIAQVFAALSLVMMAALWCSFLKPEVFGILPDPYAVSIWGHPIPPFALAFPMYCVLVIFSWIAIYFGRQTGPWRLAEIFSMLGIIVGYIPLGVTVGKILGGLSWGRPLRINGHKFNPKEALGNHWAKGDRADLISMDPETKKALETLWLHDARKEFASVPAFSRLTWQLTALGAPPELLKNLHLAGLQEIDHTQRCLALASGFGDRNWSFGEMPEVLYAFNNITGDPYAFLAKESLLDGCLLEAFNADTAQEAAKICQDSNSLKVIEKIAREERFHADISWEVLEFCFRKNPSAVKQTVLSELKMFSKIARPTMASNIALPFVEKANAKLLMYYGRLPDSEFDVLWNLRLNATKERAFNLIAQSQIFVPNASLTVELH